MTMMTFDPLSVHFWLPIGVAVLCGAIVGIDRELRDKPAGLRTSILIVVGTTIFISLGRTIDANALDPSRVLGQVITGIGFIGAGVMMTRNQEVKGVTTAAVVWLLAGIGSIVGFGHYTAAIAMSLLIIVILVGVEWLEDVIIRATGRVKKVRD